MEYLIQWNLFSKMKKYFFCFSLTIVLFQISCNNDSTGNTQYQLNYVGSRMFVQPLNKIISLSFASLRTKVFFEFIDSTYCNITISSASGDKIQSRKYKIDKANFLTLENPITDRKVHFKMSAQNDSTIYLINDQGEKMYRMLSGSEVTNTLDSNNELKKEELLYPTLDAKEREFGAEDRFVKTADGKLNSISHPMKEQARKVNVYELF